MSDDWVVLTDEMLEETQKDAELAESSRGFYRVGKLAIGMGRLQRWVDRKPQPVTYEEFLKLAPKDRSFEYTFDIDIKEFDDRARTEGWSYTRNVNPRSANWYQIVEPSLDALLGKGCVTSEHRSKTIRDLQGKYVAILDVPQAPGKDGVVPANKDTGRPYTTVKFARIFKDRDEAKAFFDELKAKSAAAQGETPASNLPAVPKVWSSDPNMLFHMLKTQYNNMTPVEAAMTTMLIDKKTLEIAVTESGAKIDLCAIFAKAYDQPAEMYADTFKAFA